MNRLFDMNFKMRYYYVMRVIVKSVLVKQYNSFSDCQEALERWYKLISKNNYKNLAEVKSVFPHVDSIGDLTVFIIGENKYRLIVKIIYKLNRVYIGNFPTNGEYNINRWKDQLIGLNVKSENKIIQKLLKGSSLIYIPQNDKEYIEMADILFKLAREVDENKEHPLFRAMELLTISIEHYDNDHFQVVEADGVSILKYFMERFDLRQKDFQNEFGTQGAVSEILNRKQKLNSNQIEKLSKRFLVSPAVFF